MVEDGYTTVDGTLDQYHLRQRVGHAEPTPSAEGQRTHPLTQVVLIDPRADGALTS